MKKLCVFFLLFLFLGSEVLFGQDIEYENLTQDDSYSDYVPQNENHFSSYYSLPPVHAISDSLDSLKDGNNRFQIGVRHPLSETPEYLHPQATPKYRMEVAGWKKQYPRAAVISCADSRVPVEIVFGQAINDIFCVRNAGNSFLETGGEYDSILYATEHLENPPPLVVILGHRKCGAVKETVIHMEKNQNELNPEAGLPKVLQPIANPYWTVKNKFWPSTEWIYNSTTGAVNDKFLILVEKYNVRANVRRFLQHIKKNKNGTAKNTYSKVTGGPTGTNSEIRVIGALYHLKSGIIDFYGPHPGQSSHLGIEPVTIDMPEKAEYQGW